MKERILTSEELTQLTEAFADPNFRDQWIKNMIRENMVEVDNPMRREIRPRRGTDEV